MAVAFGLFNAGLPSERFRAVQQRFRAHQWPGVVDAVRFYVTQDGDMRRYFSYAEAALGRPYQSYFIRSAPEWRRVFTAAEPYRPDDLPTVTPPHPLVPYRDYLVEYPPGFFLVSIPPAIAAREADTYVKLFEALMAAALTGAFLLMIRTVGRLGSPIALGSTMASAAFAMLLLGVVATHRYDAAVAFAIAIAAWAIVAEQPVILGLAVGIGIALKGTPALMLPVIVMHVARERRFRDLVTIALTLAVTVTILVLPSVLSAGAQLVELLRYHVDRPVEIESTWGAALGLVRQVVPTLVAAEKSFGSSNVVGPLGSLASRLSSIATGGALLAVYFVTWRRLVAVAQTERARVALEATTAAFAVFMTFNKICSPQYLVWILPLGLVLLLSGGQRAQVIVFLVILALTQAIYPVTFRWLERLEAEPCALVLVRNLTLLGWATLLLYPRAQTAVSAISLGQREPRRSAAAASSRS